jgi:hypothetical protein
MVARRRIFVVHLGQRRESNPKVRFIITAHSRRLDQANSSPSSRRPQCATVIIIGATTTTGSAGTAARVSEAASLGADAGAAAAGDARASDSVAGDPAVGDAGAGDCAAGVAQRWRGGTAPAGVPGTTDVDSRLTSSPSSVILAVQVIEAPGSGAEGTLIGSV